MVEVVVAVAAAWPPPVPVPEASAGAVDGEKPAGRVTVFWTAQVLGSSPWWLS